ncbi:MAG: lipoyl(octanoyl) transferase LipB [bacterium]|nr:lipoyl(octanoyl) transferase LipB [bacterium]
MPDRFAEIPVLRWTQDLSYEEASHRQEERVSNGEEALILCEHPPTITLGSAAEPGDLLQPIEYYASQGITIHESPRGGKVTYHGPGQLVVYPIINLRARGVTVHGHLRFLEDLMIGLSERYGVKVQRIEGKSGAWVDHRKIGFVGVRVRKGFSYHGLSLNVSPQHDPFSGIVPCGMPNLHVTSLQEEAVRPVSSLWDVADRMEALALERLPEYLDKESAA